MKVKISYSVDMDGVPNVVADMVAEHRHSIVRVKNMHEDIMQLLQSHESSTLELKLAEQYITSLRWKLAELDVCLKESSEILSSYVNHIEGLEQPSAPTQEQALRKAQAKAIESQTATENFMENMKKQIVDNVDVD